MTYRPCTSIYRYTSTRTLTWIAVGAALPIIFGGGPRMVTVSGTVQYKGKPIETIAALTGFCHAPHFSNTFKKLEGISPIRYRNQ